MTPTSPRSLHLPWLVLVLLAFAAWAGCLWRRTLSPAAAASAHTPATPGIATPPAQSSVRVGEREPEPAHSPTGEPARPTMAPSRDEDLRAALRHLARTDLSDAAALEAALRPLLVPGANWERVLSLLRAGGLADGSRLALEELGALRALIFGIGVFNPAPGTSSTLAAEGHGMDGRWMVLQLLRALPDILDPSREILADMIGSQRDENGRAILDTSYLAELERLAHEHPEIAALYERLIAGLLAQGGTEADALQALFLDEDASPTLVSAALARWLGENPAAALAWAAESYDAPGATDDLRHAISAAIAQAAPVEDATHFLAERARRTMLVEFLTVGGREGGLESLEQAYWEQRILESGSPDARTMLISGMTALGTERLLAISLEDPAPKARAQAWVTLTFSDQFRPNAGVLQRLQESWEQRADPLTGVPVYALISAAGNFANSALQHAPELLRPVTDILVAMVRDPGLSEREREQALEKLETLLTPEEFSQLSRER